MDDPNVTYEADETFDSVSVSSVSSVDTYSDLGSPRLTGVRGVLQAGDKLRERVEDFCNDIHDAYTFDLNPEYRVKIVKKFDGLSVGARFDFRSGDCVLKAKRAPSARQAERNQRGVRGSRLERIMVNRASSSSPLVRVLATRGGRTPSEDRNSATAKSELA